MSNNIFQIRKNKLYNYIASDSGRLRHLFDFLESIPSHHESKYILEHLFYSDNRFLDYFLLDFLHGYKSCERFCTIYFNHKKAMRKIEINGLKQFNYQFLYYFLLDFLHR